MTGDYAAAHAAGETALRELTANRNLVKVALGRSAAPPEPAARPADPPPDLVRAASVGAIVATVETARGNTAEAEEVLRDTLPRVSAALGADHPLALALRRRQALVWLRTGRNAAALPELETLAAPGPEGKPRGTKREALLVRAALAESLLAAGARARAEEVAAAALPEVDASVPANHLDRAELRVLLARAIAARGDRAEARRLLADAARSLPSGHPFRREIEKADAGL